MPALLEWLKNFLADRPESAFLALSIVVNALTVLELRKANLARIADLKEARLAEDAARKEERKRDDDRAEKVRHLAETLTTMVQKAARRSRSAALGRPGDTTLNIPRLPESTKKE